MPGQEAQDVDAAALRVEPDVLMRALVNRWRPLPAATTVAERAHRRLDSLGLPLFRFGTHRGVDERFPLTCDIGWHDGGHTLLLHADGSLATPATLEALANQIEAALEHLAEVPDATPRTVAESLPPLHLDLVLAARAGADELRPVVEQWGECIGLAAEVRVSQPAWSPVATVELPRIAPRGAVALLVTPAEILGHAPQDIELAGVNPDETRAVRDEIFVRRAYFRHGVALHEGAVVVDVGANIGAFTVFCHHECDDVTVHALEPAPEVAAVLEENVARHGVRAVVHRAACAAEDGEADFTYYPHSTLQSGLHADRARDAEVVRQHAGARLDDAAVEDRTAAVASVLERRHDAELLRVPTRSVSSLIEEHGLERIDLLKVDAEGSENEILRGIAREHWPRIRQVVLEGHGGGDAIAACLREQGFHVASEEDPETGHAIVYAHRGCPRTSARPARAAAAVAAAAETWTTCGGSYAVDIVLLPGEDDSAARRVLSEAVPATAGVGLVDLTGVEMTELAVGTALARRLTAVARRPTKAIIVDADDTLWGGICGEVGPGGVAVDKPFLEVQTFLANQRARGRILCLCSRNNPEDVEGVFARHPAMPLSFADFTAVRIGWGSKAEATTEMLGELGIDPESAIYVDDDPAVREEMRLVLPAMTVVDLPVDPVRRRACLEETWQLDADSLTAEDCTRAAHYRADERRQEAARGAATFEDYLDALALEVDITPSTGEEIERLSQLARRTNQFNASLRRHRPADVERLVAASPIALSVRVVDRFGDYGLVGFAAATCCDAALEITDLLLSCRALGRNVEWAMARELARRGRELGAGRIVIRTQRGTRNQPALDFAAEAEACGIDELTRLDWRRARGGAEAMSRLAASPSYQRGTAQRWPAPAEPEAVAETLTARRRERPALATPYATPRTELERRVATAWEKLLGIDGIGIDDDLFALGGDSLTALRLAARLTDHLGRRVRLATVLDHPTIAALTARLDAQPAEEAPPEGAPSAAAALPFPATRGQRRVWEAEVMVPGTADQVIPLAYRLDRDVDPDRLERRLRALVERHPALHTTLELRGELLQVAAAPQFTLERVDLSEEEAFFATPFNPGAGCQLRAAIAEDGDNRRLLVAVHHAAADGSSVELLEHELSAPVEPEGPAAPFALYAAAVLERERRGEFDETLARMDVELPSAAALPAPRRGARSPSHLRFDLPCDRLRAAAARYGTTPFALQLAAFGLVLAVRARRDRVTLGFPVANREGARHQAIVGFLANLVPLELVITEGEGTVAEYVQDAGGRFFTALRRGDVPYGLWLERRSRGGRAGGPGFTALVTEQPPRDRELSLAGGRAEPAEPAWWPLPFEFMLDVEQRDAGAVGLLRFDAAWLGAREARALADAHGLVLRMLCELPSEPITRVREVAGEVLRIAPAALSGRRQRLEATDLPSLIFRHPLDAVAVEDARGTLTYRELDAEVRATEERLVAQGVTAGDAVAVRLARDARLVVTILAILRRRAHFVPLDPALPRGRVEAILADAEPRLVVDGDLPPERVAGAPRRCRADDLAYVLYTSGSTGRPKGVAVTHESLANYLLWAAHEYTRNDGRGSLVHSSVAVDLTLTSLLVPLVCGETVHLLASDDPEELAAALRRTPPRLSFLKLTPSGLALLREQLTAEEIAAATAHLVLGGEQLGASLVDQLTGVDGLTITNEYGPTETVVGCIAHTFGAGAGTGDPVPIGRPIWNTNVGLVDDEIVIGGRGVARGYLNDPPQSAAFADGRYRTGDLARLRDDGLLEYVGRRDRQLKVHGYRVDPSEVEHVLWRHSDVAAVCVVPRGRTLHAFVVPAAGAGALDGSLRAWAADLLPAHARPDGYEVLESLPLTASGKVDVRALTERANRAQGRAPATLPPAPAPATPGSPMPSADAVCTVAARLLGAPSVDATDNFFALGGDSILALHLVSELRTLGLELTVRDVIAKRTLGSIAEVAAAPAPRAPEDASGTLPLTPNQRAFFALQPRAPDDWVIESSFQPTERIDAERLRYAFRRVERRHPALRTRFERTADGWHAFLADTEPVLDTCRVAPDLNGGPLARLALLGSGDGRQELVLSVHHLVADIVSIEVLLRELWAAYDGEPVAREHEDQYLELAGSAPAAQPRFSGRGGDAVLFDEVLPGAAAALAGPIPRRALAVLAAALLDAIPHERICCEHHGRDTGGLEDAVGWLTTYRVAARAADGTVDVDAVHRALAEDAPAGEALPAVALNFAGALGRATERVGASCWSFPPSPLLFPLQLTCWFEVDALRTLWAYDPLLHSEDDVRRIAAAFRAALGRHADAAQEEVNPATPGQQGMVLASLARPHDPLFVEQVAVPLRGPLNVDCLRARAAALIRRHEVLRVAFTLDSNVPQQVVHPAAPVDVELIDDAELPAAEQDVALERLLERQAMPFDLTRPPLLRLGVQRRAPDAHVLTWTHHHSILDGWSQIALLEELLAEEEPRGTPASFTRHAAALDGAPAPPGEDEFWRRRLDGWVAPPPLARLPDPGKGGRHGHHERRIGSAESLRAWAREAESTVASAVVAAWAAVSSRLRSGRTDVVLGVTVGGRSAELPDTTEMIGPLATTVPVRVSVRPGVAPAELVRAVQEAVAEAAEHGRTAPSVPIDSAVAIANYPRSATITADWRARGGLTLLPLTLVTSIGDGVTLRLVNDRTRIADEQALDALDALASSLEALADGACDRLAAALDAVPVLAVADDTGGEEHDLDVLVQAFSGALDEARVDAESDFLASGGDSLHAVRLLERLRDVLGVDLTLRDLIDAPTPRALKERIDGRAAEAEARPAIRPRVEDGSPFPLSGIQEIYWVGRQRGFDLSGVDAHVYGEVEVRDLDLDRLTRCWNALIDRHAMLRAVFTADGRQRILDRVGPYEIATTDLRARPPERELAAMRERLAAPRRRLDRWPLFTIEAALLNGVTRLFVSVDMLIGDAFSWQLLYRELSTLYRGAELEPLRLTYRDYVEWLPALRDTRTYARDRDYWRERLDALPPPPALPLARTTAAVENVRFARRTVTLEAERTAALRALASQLGSTLSGLLVTAYAEILGRYSESDGMLLNLTLFSRPPVHEQIDSVVGDFTGLELLGVDGAGGTFADRVARVQRQLWSDLSHSAYGGVEVLRDLARRSGSATAAHAPVVFTSTLDLPQVCNNGVPPIPYEPVWGIGQTPQVTLDYQVYEHNGRLTVSWDAVEQVFPEGLLDDMFAAHRTLLERLADDPAAAREASPAAPPTNPVPIGEPLGGTQLLHEPFLAAAAAAPEAIGVVASDRSLTYGETRALALRCAAQLADGCEPVAVVMEKGWEQVVAVLGASIAGRPFVPMDANWPVERLRDLFATTGATAALVQRRTTAAALDVPPIVIDALTPDPRDRVPRPACSADDVAYVIFTSGSTGRPKGVAIQHHAALNTVLDINQRFGVRAADRVLAISPLLFDLAIYDIFGLLGAGGAIVMPSEADRRDPVRWAELVAEQGVSVWNSVPVLMEMLAGTGRPLPSLRVCLLSGDWIPLTLPAAVRERAPGVQVVSLGGATEGSIWSIFHEIGALDPSWSSIPYGRALTGQSVQVLGRDGLPAPMWVPGEIHIGGHGVALGYWREPDLTTRAFVRDGNGRLLYRTGDWGRLRPGGLVEFLGRRDQQVKVAGHRVELQEIEAAVRTVDGVTQATVVAAGSGGGRRLVAYVAGSTSAEELRASLTAVLPDYMVPARIVKVDKLPLSDTGKVDRRRLEKDDRSVPEPAHTAGARGGGPAAEAATLELVASFLGHRPSSADTDLIAEGMTSIDIMRTFNAFEESFGTRPDLEAFYGEPTVRTLADALYVAPPNKAAPPAVADPPSPWSAHPLLVDRHERAAFRSARPAYPAPPAARLLPGEPPAATSRAPSPRSFAPVPVRLAALDALLRCLARAGDGRFSYPSAGGLYGVAAHLHVRPGRVEDVPPGLYEYHPEAHELAPVMEGIDLDAEVHRGIDNRALATTAAFTIFLTTDPADSAPLYGGEGERLALLNAGYIGQLLCESASAGLGLCPLHGFHFDRVRWLFQAPERVQLLHLLVGGVPA